MKLGKRIISLILAFAIISGLCPQFACAAEEMTANEATTTEAENENVIQAPNEFAVNTAECDDTIVISTEPGYNYAGSALETGTLSTISPMAANIVMNGVDIGYASGSYFTKNGSSCANSYWSNGRCHHNGVCTSTAHSQCNCMRYWPTGNSSTCQVDLLGSQCLAFARYCQWKVYGSFATTSSSYWTNLTGALSTSSCTASTLKSKLLGCAPATHVRMPSPHSISVISTSDSGITFADCNADGYCKVRTVTYSWADFATYVQGKGGIDYAYSRVGVSGGTTSCTCSTSYAGEYICTTSSANLNIRNGHGSSYSVIGSIPPGATVTVSKASGTSTSDWAHVTYNGVSGYASMQYLQKVTQSTQTSCAIRLWMSDTAYGDVPSTLKAGNRYYLCYRLYDSISGKDWDEVATQDYTVEITYYNPDGSVLHSAEFTDDQSWISVFFSEAGTYSCGYDVSGDLNGSDSASFTIHEDPKNIYASTSSLSLQLGGTDSSTIYVWTDGYYNGSTSVSWSRSNSNISCSWGTQQDDGRHPLTITANSVGTTTLTLSSKVTDTGEVLDSITMTVTVTAKTYTVSYNANGGSGAPSSQTKTHGTALTLSSTIPTRFGYTFLGWATSSSATSAAYTAGGSYTSNAAATLYAVWAAATEISGNYAGFTRAATISNPGAGVYYKFTPYTSTYYRIYGTDDLDTRVYLYDSSGNQLGANDDGGEGNQFQLDYNFTSGETYYIYVRFYGSGQTGTLDFKVAYGYRIKYNANGGSGAPSTTYKYYNFDTTLSTVEPTRSGYTFLGWASSSSATAAEYQPGDTFSTNTNTTLYAVWDQDTYTVTYNANGGSGGPSSQTKTGGTALTLSTTLPTRFGYTFLGWATSSSATSAAYLPGGSFTTDANTTLHAVWQSASTISSGVTNASCSAAISFANGYKYYSFTPSFTGKIQLESTGTSDTRVYVYDSSGNQLGYNDDSGADNNFLLTQSVTSGTKYYIMVRHYSSGTGTINFTVKRAYDITYNANGGSGAPSAQVKVYGTSLTLSSAVPTRSGYTFMGWSTSASATSASYQSGGSFTSNANTTLYAVWKPGTYTISYNANGGSGAPSSQTKTHGVTLTLSTTKPTRSGYTFQGWATSSTATSASYQPGGSFTTNANTTLYAVWKPGTYTISYNANGGSGAPSSQTKTHGVTLTLSTTKPTRSGYTFQGWSTSSTATSASYQPGGSFTTNANTTLYAVWKSSNLASGSCGSNVTWTLGSSGVLTVSGTGAMTDYTYKSEMPWYSYRSQITSVVLNSGVTSIGDYAFYGMPSLESIEIPATVTAIGDYAFKNCSALNDVALPDNLTKLGDSAFYACTSLTSMEIPAKLYTIKPYTFKNCTALASVTFHEGNLEKISDGAFYNTALTELTLPDCLNILDMYAFKNCSKLRSIDLGSGLSEIREAVFYGTAIPTITIPEGITKIGPYAFKNCVKLVSIDLPESLTSVGEASFYACTALESLELPDAVTKIGNYAFRKCAALLEVHFGSGLTNIGESSFYGCESIVYLAIPGKVTTIQGYAFKGCTALEIVELPASVKTLGDSAFHTCTSLSEITIPGGVTKLGEYCFSGSNGIDQITFEGSAPTIGTGAFNKITATARYPEGNTTWTASVRQNYGGTITWIAQ